MAGGLFVFVLFTSFHISSSMFILGSTRHQHADSGQVASLHPLSEPLETAGGPLSFSRLVDEGCTKAICMQHP
jgi:hypothetical protein